MAWSTLRTVRRPELLKGGSKGEYGKEKIREQRQVGIGRCSCSGEKGTTEGFGLKNDGA